MGRRENWPRSNSGSVRVVSVLSLDDFAQGPTCEAGYHSLNLAMQKPAGRLPSLSVESDFHPHCFIAKANICIKKISH